MILIQALLILSSVCHEQTLSPHEGAKDTVQLTATICEYRHESDGDYHLYISDSGCGMIAEVVPHSKAMETFLELIDGQPQSKSGKYWIPIKVTITGIRYFDHEHFKMPNRCGLRPDTGGYHIEIHPVTQLAIAG